MPNDPTQPNAIDPLNASVPQALAHLRAKYGQEFPSEFFYRPPPDPADRTFDLGLCLAGSVSAGAYLAGVVDFLVEALDAWVAEKAARPGATPNHSVRLSAFSGTSGGGMTAIILGTMLHRKVTPARAGTAPSFEQNPLYGAWVKGIDIRHLLDSDDLKADGARLQSFLNSSRITELARSALLSKDEAVARAYVANPLHVGVTIANLNGLAYEFELRTETKFGYQARVHEDVVRLVLQFPGGSGKGDLPASPNERVVRLDEQPQGNPEETWPAAWRLLRQAATATGAFPAGLLPRDVVRDWTECDPRILPLRRIDPGGTVADGRVAILPALRGLAAVGPYSCVCVDGGSFNNEPFDIARSYLSGILGSNPRDGAQASRAVIMVDPLVQPDPDDLERIRPRDTVLRFISGLVFRAFKNQARTHLTEWTLAMADDIYSRYLITPVRGNVAGDGAICGSVLGAFGGFLTEAYREHDFRLGRRNCQKFLRDHFTLPAENPLFAGWRDQADLRLRFAPRGPDGQPDPSQLPIVPLVGLLASEAEPEPEWPAPREFEKVREKTYERIEKRLDAVYDALTRESNWFVRRYLDAGWLFARPRLVKAVEEAIEKALREKKLF